MEVLVEMEAAPVEMEAAPVGMEARDLLLAATSSAAAATSSAAAKVGGCGWGRRRGAGRGWVGIGAMGVGRGGSEVGE
ncbi:hypothetical protein KY290_030849 [Solanum tuberosum]|uniref:Uncharacterized protein n=1 Tax=Solanum tuberosum TaxID=4113 RepID=A0ABQ7U7G4_SOLTU|nr:hypothetical protein KY290_030849 [Solanum tuberosum]